MQPTEEFTDSRAALKQRFALEHRFTGNPNIEIVVLGAASSEALRATHARYFTDSRDLYGESLKRVGRIKQHLRAS